MGLIVRDAGIIQRVDATFAHDVGGPATTVLHAVPTIATATKTVATSSSSFTVSVQVSPNPIPYGAYPTVTIHASAAVCAISVRYASGKGPTSYPDHSATANAAGVIVEQGRWHMESKSSGGTVSANCSSHEATATGAFSVQIG
jgi:hypothetical protein